MKKLFLLPSAQTDMDSIWSYTADQWGFNQADRYIDDLLDACEALAAGDKQGRPFEPRENYFRYTVRSHVIYFHDGGNTMRIVRILHGGMDAIRHL